MRKFLSAVIVAALSLGGSTALPSPAAATVAPPMVCNVKLDPHTFSLSGGRAGAVMTAISQCSIPMLVSHVGAPRVTTVSGAWIAGGTHCAVGGPVPCTVTSRFIRGKGTGKKRVYIFTATFLMSLPKGFHWSSGNMPTAKRGGWTTTQCYGYGTPVGKCSLSYAFAL